MYHKKIYYKIHVAKMHTLYYLCFMKLIDWNTEKNVWLLENRGICFQDVLHFIVNDLMIDDIEHPNKEKYPEQRIFVLDIDGYVNLVPYIETEDEVFLKTIIPSRKATKKFLGDKND